MSALTKIFVVLLVVCSIMTSAATVVFVNKGDDFQAQLTQQAAQLAEARDSLAAANDAAAGARAELLSAQSALSSKESTDQIDEQKLASDLAEKNSDLQAAQRTNQAHAANIQALEAQLAIALRTNEDNNHTINDLRDMTAKQLQNQAETDAALANQRQLAETYGRQVEYLKEVNQKLEEQVKAYAAVVTSNHLALPAAPVYTGAGSPEATGDTSDTAQPVSNTTTPQVTGEVRDKSDINGVTYLTISVGAADNVAPGMEFSVVDTKAQPPQFLGILTITQADANSAIGRLQGDSSMVAKVKGGDEVTTHLQ